MVGDIFSFVRLFRVEVKFYCVKVSREMSVKVFVIFILNIFYSGRGFVYMVWFFVGGYDFVLRLYFIDVVGGVIEDCFIVVGFGMEFVFFVLEENYCDGIFFEEGVKFVFRVIKVVIKRDVFMGGGVIFVMIIEEGYCEWSEEELKFFFE